MENTTAILNEIAQFCPKDCPFLKQLIPGKVYGCSQYNTSLRTDAQNRALRCSPCLNPENKTQKTSALLQDLNAVLAPLQSLFPEELTGTVKESLSHIFLLLDQSEKSICIDILKNEQAAVLFLNAFKKVLSDQNLLKKTRLLISSYDIAQKNHAAKMALQQQKKLIAHLNQPIQDKIEKSEKMRRERIKEKIIALKKLIEDLKIKLLEQKELEELLQKKLEELAKIEKEFKKLQESPNPDTNKLKALEILIDRMLLEITEIKKELQNPAAEAISKARRAIGKYSLMLNAKKKGIS